LSIEVGSVVEGVVTGITNFGAFVELDEGKTGLVHISEVADEYVRDIHDFLQERQKVKVKVLSVDERGKIGLSVKQAQEKKPEAEDNRAHGNHSSFHAPRSNNHGPRDFRKPNRYSKSTASFEDKLSKFLKDSDERLTDLRRKTDSKRGGRGARRSD